MCGVCLWLREDGGLDQGGGDGGGEKGFESSEGGGVDRNRVKD